MVAWQQLGQASELMMAGGVVDAFGRQYRLEQFFGGLLDRKRAVPRVVCQKLSRNGKILLRQGNEALHNLFHAVIRSALRIARS